MRYMKKPVGITFEVGINKNRNIHINIGPQRFGKIRPRARIQTSTYEDTVEIAHYGGIKIDAGFGTIRRPIAKFWKKEFWSRDYGIKNPATNPWNSGNHWFVLTIPLLPYIFISCMIGRWNGESRLVKTLQKIFRTPEDKKYPEYMPGFYIGGRTAYVNNWTHYLAKYDEKGDVSEWVKYNDAPVCAWGNLSEDGNVYVEPTVALRSDFIH